MSASRSVSPLEGDVERDLVDAELLRPASAACSASCRSRRRPGAWARSLAHAGALASAPRWPPPSSRARPGSSARTSRAPSSARGDDVRVTVRATSRLDAAEGPRRRDRRGRRHRPARGAAGAARRRRGCSTWPARRTCALSADDLFHINVAGHADGARGVPAGRRRARRAHLLGGRGRPGAGRRRRRRAPGLARRRARHPLRRLQARGGGRGAADRRARAAGGRRLPRLRARRRRHAPLLDRARAPLHAAPHPRLRRRRDQHRRRRRRGGRPPARRRAAACRASATSSATATTPGTACSPTSRGSRASRRRPSSCPSPAALALAETLGRLPGPTPVTPVEIRSAAHWWTYRSTKARRELGWTHAPARGDRRGDGGLVPRARGRRGCSARARRHGARLAGRRLHRARGSGSSCRDARACTAAARRRTGSARAAASRASSSASGIETETVRVAAALARPRRGRRADRPAARARWSSSAAR